MIEVHNPYVGPGSGKASATLRWLTENHDKRTAHGRPKASVYITSRSEIETLDFSRFLTSFGPHLTKAALRRIHGKIIFAVDGYDDTGLDLFEIEEVRRFYSILNTIWPCWLFAGSLLGTNLRAVMLCLIPNLEVRRTQGECRIRFSREDVLSFFESCIPATVYLQYSAGLGKHAGLKLLKTVSAHLGIPEN